MTHRSSYAHTHTHTHTHTHRHTQTQININTYTHTHTHTHKHTHIQGHKAAVTAIDWSIDSKNLMSDDTLGACVTLCVYAYLCM
jgi:hypothetical protein